MGAATYLTDFMLHKAIVMDGSVCALWIGGFTFTVWRWVLDRADRDSVLGVMGPLRCFFEKAFGSAATE